MTFGVLPSLSEISEYRSSEFSILSFLTLTVAPSKGIAPRAVVTFTVRYPTGLSEIFISNFLSLLSGGLNSDICSSFAVYAKFYTLCQRDESIFTASSSQITRPRSHKSLMAAAVFSADPYSVIKEYSSTVKYPLPSKPSRKR